MDKQTPTHTIEPGYWVALALHKGAAPLRCYVGQVQCVDKYGVRVTLMDWLMGRPAGWDFFVPWASITAVLIATPDHDVASFGEAAANFQNQCKELP